MSSIINKTKLRTMVKLIRIMLWLKKESIRNKKLIKVEYSATKYSAHSRILQHF